MSPDPAPTVDPTQLRVEFGHEDGDVTVVGFPFLPGDEGVQTLADGDREALNPESRKKYDWLHSLPVDQQPYFTHIDQVDQIWEVHGKGALPVWVDTPQHPAFERLIAAHFTGRGHVCLIKTDSGELTSGTQ